MMNKSSRFISLSGLSGVLAGIYALIGSWFAHQRLAFYLHKDYSIISNRNSIKFDETVIMELLIIAFSIGISAVLTGILLSVQKAKKSKEKLWNVSSKRLLINFLIPLIGGGIFCLVLIQYNIFYLISSATLVFYGLACINASKYTLGDVRFLGVAILLLGLVSTQFLGYGLYFWALGFGVCHIFYGALMYFKHDRT